MLFPQLFHFLKDRTEIGSASALDGNCFTVSFPFFRRMDHRDILHEAVALDQADVPSGKEVFFFFKNAACLTKELCYNFSFARAGCVDCDDQLFEAVSFPRLRRLDERETAVVLQAVMVGDWVKTVEIQFHLLTGDGELF